MLQDMENVARYGHTPDWKFLQRHTCSESIETTQTRQRSLLLHRVNTYTLNKDDELSIYKDTIRGGYSTPNKELLRKRGEQWRRIEMETFDRGKKPIKQDSASFFASGIKVSSLPALHSIDIKPFVDSKHCFLSVSESSYSASSATKTQLTCIPNTIPHSAYCQGSFL